jgi:hypothetical protein
VGEDRGSKEMDGCLLTDGKSHFIIIYLQKTKDETFDTLKAYIARAEAITGE